MSSYHNNRKICIHSISRLGIASRETTNSADSRIPTTIIIPPNDSTISVPHLTYLLTTLTRCTLKMPKPKTFLKESKPKKRTAKQVGAYRHGMLPGFIADQTISGGSGHGR